MKIRVLNWILLFFFFSLFHVALKVIPFFSFYLKQSLRTDYVKYIYFFWFVFFLPFFFAPRSSFFPNFILHFIKIFLWTTYTRWYYKEYHYLIHIKCGGWIKFKLRSPLVLFCFGPSFRSMSVHERVCQFIHICARRR